MFYCESFYLLPCSLFGHRLPLAYLPSSLRCVRISSIKCLCFFLLLFYPSSSYFLPLLLLPLLLLLLHIFFDLFLLLSSLFILPFIIFRIIHFLHTHPLCSPDSPPYSSTSSCSSVPLSIVSRLCPLHLSIHPPVRNIPYERLVSTTVRCREGPRREVMLRFSWLSSVPRVLRR